MALIIGVVIVLLILFGFLCYKNGFDVSTVDANAAQLYRTELAGETTVDNSTNAAPAPTE